MRQEILQMGYEAEVKDIPFECLARIPITLFLHIYHYVSVYMVRQGSSGVHVVNEIEILFLS